MDDVTPERWQPVPGWEGFYEVSEFGHVRSSPDRIGVQGLRKGRFRALRIHRRAWFVTLSLGGARKAFPVHELVAAAFLGACPEGCELRCLDGNRLNASLANLAYLPPLERGPADTADERWLPIVDWEGLYEASDLGRIRRLRGRNGWGYYNKVTVLKPSVSKQGYYMVRLWRDQVPKGYMVHRLIARTFLGPRPDGLEIRHLNDDKLDNRVVNLTYGTHRENMLDIVRNGNHDRASLTHCAICGKPYDEANTYIPPDRPNIRLCRNCMRRRRREYERRKKAGLVKPRKKAA